MQAEKKTTTVITPDIWRIVDLRLRLSQALVQPLQYLFQLLLLLLGNSWTLCFVLHLHSGSANIVAI